MKAYQITHKYFDCTRAFVVFAPNANKARSMVRPMLYEYGYNYILIKARRLPLIDRFYDGQEVVNHYDPKVRQILVEEYGWMFGGLFDEQNV